MIIVSVGCGLGNQMFEYAFLVALMERYPDVKIKIDNRYLLPIQHNGYELNRVFGICAEVCEKQEVKELAEYSNENCWYRRIFHLKRKIKQKLGMIKESYFFQKDYTKYYDEVFHLDISKSYYLHGVWANYRYFEFVKDKVIDLFSFKQPINEKTRFYKEKIVEGMSISIHIRRGDYRKTPKLLLEDKYYKEAISMMEERFDDIYWYVFSDEIDMTKEMLKGKNNVIYVEGNKGEDSWMDMYLMSLCKHNIIANSTFSFWGAYLNKNPNKCVISSAKPFEKCEVPFTVDGWISI